MKISEIITDKYKLRLPPTVYYDILADVVEVELDILLSQKRNSDTEWIPVSERLPEENGKYLVTEYDDLKRINRIDITLWSDSQTISNGFYSARDVTAWMPLPKPYEESDTE